MVKFLLIGLDGADPELIQQFDMPNLKAVMKKGSHGKLRSTLPPITAPAWSSIITGKDPSWHDVTHFVDTDPFFGRKQLISSKSIKCKKIWQILNDHGFSCGIYTVPITYPVEKLNGFMVSGMTTPGPYSQMYPKIDIKVKPFIEWQYIPNMSTFYNDLLVNTEHKFKLLRWFMQKYNVDFLFMVESNTDSIQHRLFHEVGLEENRLRTVGKFFSIVDEEIGKILDIADCPVLFVSDHGFGKHPTKWVYGNAWLREKGLIYYSNNKVDWNKTKTYFYRAWLNCGFIKNNVGDVIDDLKKEPWVEDIWLSKELYSGPYAKEMPDIIFTFAEEYTGNERLDSYQSIEEIPVFSRWTGHRMDGFWACSEKIKLQDLTDVAPVILKLMGLENAVKELGSPIDPIPENIKGKISKNTFS